MSLFSSFHFAQLILPYLVDFFAGKSEAEIEKFIALCKQAEAFQKDE